MTNEQLQQKICAAICHGNGLKAREIAKLLNLDRNTVNHVLFTSHLLRDLCYQDDDYRWHGLIKQTVPHSGLAKEVYAADVVQAAKYVPYLEIVFGPNYDVIPALVVTRAKNHFLFYEIEGRDGILPACSGDRLYDVFDEYLDLYE